MKRLALVALAIAPGYHVAEAGLARAVAALGQTAEAIAWYGRAIDAVPQPDYLAERGDLYAISGDLGRATSAHDTVEVGAALSPASARLYDRQLAVFYLDHDRPVDRALTIAEAALARGDATRAKAELERAFAISVAFDPILAGRGRTLLAWLEALG